MQRKRGHAGAEETSVNLALYSHLVNKNRTVYEKPRRHKIQVEGLTLPLDTIDETSSGVFGKQTTASAEKGKKVLEAVISELVTHVDLLEKSRIEDLLEKPKI